MKHKPSHHHRLYFNQTLSEGLLFMSSILYTKIIYIFKLQLAPFFNDSPEIKV